jgi:molecular chaperone HscB
MSTLENAKQDAPNACAACGHAVEGHFCDECGRIQPLSEGADYFGFLGFPRRLGLDIDELEKRFYALSRRFHPDYFMNATEAERKASIERSSRLNDAYRTLRDPIARTQYLLSIEGYKEAEKKAPPDLLEEVFELNMQIEELKNAKKAGDEEETAEARSSLEREMSGLVDKQSEIDERLDRLFNEWDEDETGEARAEQKKQTLDRLSELLSYRSYISNLLGDIEEEL